MDSLWKECLEDNGLLDDLLQEVRHSFEFDAVELKRGASPAYEFGTYKSE